MEITVKIIIGADVYATRQKAKRKSEPSSRVTRRRSAGRRCAEVVGKLEERLKARKTGKIERRVKRKPS